ncbi:DMSO/selenate family reductase complex B subunit [Providencia huaxiensis]|uniref:DMSO/selenate family reductase complex B subunit n=1 Tax=Providencia huaxiensis TaxID=2027290 RepID=UPI001B39AEC7|nr:DMSO/selenate family reductase complex B subunit [Providencia huaxiensis]MBQ0532803.1 dimethylsulfoxide reductase subunit B [Providencia huaxiensis]MBQ0587269.1 dimethylsulfoxide reductase subunit B [Providencia huaxiensis]MDI7238930.1 dimethylsulfoxide reductase subunit B [Providencia huaxiensis]
MAQQYGFFVDTSKCTGCKTCQVSCKDKNELPIGVNFRRVYEYTGGEWTKQTSDDTWQQNVFAYYVSISCNHCSNPACTKACPTGAMHKREHDGLVVVDEKICVGCRYCEMACPYGALQYNPEKKHMTKCDGCFELIAQNKAPICVASCPLRALDFGPMDFLRTKYGETANIAPLPDSNLTQPSLIIRHNRHAKPTHSQQGFIINKAEW